MEDLSEISWDFLEESNPWNLIQSDSAIDALSDLRFVSMPELSSDMPKLESNWMSIIDLIQGCEL